MVSKIKCRIKTLTYKKVEDQVLFLHLNRSLEDAVDLFIKIGFSVHKTVKYTLGLEVLMYKKS